MCSRVDNPKSQSYSIAYKCIWSNIDDIAPKLYHIPVNIHNYRQVSNIRRALVGNWIFDHSDVVGASPVGAAPTTSSFST